MPEGQFLGKKGSYIYTADSGALYVLRRDQTLATLPGVDLPPATVNSDNLQATPQGIKYRGVYWQSELNGRLVRKFIICGSVLSTLYEKDVSTDLTIDGVAGYTTGKKGEAVSFTRLALAPEPPPAP